MSRKRTALGLLVVASMLLLLTALTTGFDDGSAAAHWCADRQEIVTMTAAARNDTWGQACLDLYKER